MNTLLKSQMQLPEQLRLTKPDFLRTIIEGIRYQGFLGFIECDIHVAIEMCSMCEFFLPMFANHRVNIIDVEPVMHDYVKDHSIKVKDRRGHIIEFQTSGILFFVGLCITSISQTLEMDPQGCFKGFGTW